MDEEPLLPATVPHLVKDAVHIWCLSLDISPREREHCLSLLSADEKTRSQKFYFEKARDRFTAGRGLLRTFLGLYLSLQPASVQFEYEPHGKPFLKDQLIRFNVSHAEGMGVFAFCLSHQVGVDIEWHRPLEDMDDLAQKFFTAKESTSLASLSGDAKQELFYKLWTCKESYLKAIGEGLLIPLDQVEVRFEAGGHVRLISKDGQEMSDWQSRLFSPFSGYQGAVCVEGGDLEFEFQILHP